MPAPEHGFSADEERFLQSPLLSGYWPSERRAMLVHRFYLSTRLRRQATIEETIRSWEAGVSRDWRNKKMRRDSQRQIREIERHKYFLSQRRGEDIGWEAAAEDWVQHHAARWRDWWEEQPESCP